MLLFLLHLHLFAKRFDSYDALLKTVLPNVLPGLRSLKQTLTCNNIFPHCPCELIVLL